MPRLVIIEGPEAAGSYEITDGDLTIGRDTACDVCVLDVKVSRRHSVIHCKRGRCSIEDLNSSNGTFLNGRILPNIPVALNDGDEIQVGNSVMRYVASNGKIEVFEDQETIVQTMDTGMMPSFDSLESGEGSSSALRFLLDLAREAESATNVNALAEVLAGGLEPEVGADRVILFMGRDENMQAVERDLPEHLKRLHALGHSTTVIKQVARERVAVLSRINEDDRFRDAQSVNKIKITSAICVPLVAGDELLGAIYLDRVDRKDHFKTLELELSTAAGLQCSLALMNILRMEELRASRDSLEAELNGPDGFVGQSKALKSVYSLIQRAAPTDAGVLVLGESGTGKELVARAIHRQSPRSDRPFVIVNCAALAESLAEAELFGHERGAFTGADKSRPGRFLAADGGTIFLDEIGELSEPIQAKLLRVLESGEITPVGEAGVRNIDVRVVAATNRDLAQEVQKGTFRQDLYYRLNILAINLPPLRERAEDIPLLIQHFVRFLGGRCGRPNLRISAEVLQKCQNYGWPGNVRELKNAVERMVILCDGDDITSRDLPPEIGGSSPTPIAAGAQIIGSLRTLSEVEKAHIEAVLGQCEGNKKRAAEILGIDRSTLYAKLKAYGL